MINSDNLCMSCLKEIGTLKECPYCGFHTDSQQIAPYLPIRTVLGNRYLVGKLLEYNGDGATYIGLDLSTRAPVQIREFFPIGVAARDPKLLTVNAVDGKAVLYQDLLQSFIEMWRRIMRLSGLSALVKVQDILEGNGTCYVITENIEGVTLREYLLKNNLGYISWEKARPLLMPVLSTLGTLHSSGIIHRGISPSTLIVAKDGKIRITGFSISQVRSARSELKPQLFTGYAAFEQYGFDGRQGPWTDIYGFGAVLYRTLIGTDPIDSTERVTNDRLMVPGKFAEQLPAYVINGLVNALQILPEDRTRTVEELRAELSAAPSAAVSGLEFEPANKQYPKYQNTAQRLEPDETAYVSEKREAAQKRHNRSTAVIVISSIVIVLAIIFVILFSTGAFDKLSSNSPKNETVSSDLVEVPNFVDKNINDIISDEYYSKNFVFETTSENSSEYDVDIVMNQSPKVGSSVSQGSTITLIVSKGKETIAFPLKGVKGESYETAYETLSKIGFVVKKTEKLNTDNQIPGTVAGFNLEEGKIYSKNTTVYLFVWGEPEIETTTTEATSTTANSSEEEPNEGIEGNNDEDSGNDYNDSEYILD